MTGSTSTISTEHNEALVRAALVVWHWQALVLTALALVLDLEQGSVTWSEVSRTQAAEQKDTEDRGG